MLLIYFVQEFLTVIIRALSNFIKVLAFQFVLNIINVLTLYHCNNIR